VSRYLVIGVAVPMFWDSESFEFLPGQTATENHVSLFPEATMQFSPAQNPLRAFVGAGMGLALRFQGSGPSGPTLHGMAGLQLAISRFWGIRAEARLRSVKPFQGRTLDLTLGLARHH
jgi:hypothetical protein